ncbi:hypothetical protein ACK8OR_15970 [Jannaschia sp. KMU-145]|uniref:hypothetical protein n=1 Tax=Jannaschia halovivens TaxID=3388667 RepID=UPI00396B1C9C
MKYIIDAEDELVALDLIDLLGRTDDQSEVIQLKTLSTLEPLRPAWSGGVLVTARPVRDVVTSEEVNQFIASGGRIVLLADMDPVPPNLSPNWIVLDRPFSDDAFLNALMRAQV